MGLTGHAAMNGEYKATSRCTVRHWSSQALDSFLFLKVWGKQGTREGWLQWGVRVHSVLTNRTLVGLCGSQKTEIPCCLKDSFFGLLVLILSSCSLKALGRVSGRM